MSTTKRAGSLASQVESATSQGQHFTIPFNEITQSGAYYNHTTGWLYRVPGEGLALGHSPVMNILSSDENFVTKISDDPYIPVSKARQICSNMDFAVNF
jgi:hypothetical protein